MNRTVPTASTVDGILFFLKIFLFPQHTIQNERLYTKEHTKGGFWFFEIIMIREL
jgi:hypothetical protein